MRTRIETQKMEGFEHYKPRKWLSVSDLVSFKRCPRRFFYSSGCLLAGGDHDHPALTFGESIHACLPIVMERGLEEGFKVFDSVWGDVTADEKRNPKVGKRMLEDFVRNHSSVTGIYTLVKPPERFKVDKSERVSDWEVPFAMDIGMHVPLVGRIDGLCRLKFDNSPWILEYKTTSETSTRFFTGFELSPQLCCYTLYAKTVWDKETKGAIVEALRVSTANSSTLSQPIFIQDHHLNSFIVWANKIANEIKWCEDNGEFPKDFSGCHPYSQFGAPGYQCEYAMLCKQPEWLPFKGMFRQKQERPYGVLIGGLTIEERKAAVERGDVGTQETGTIDEAQCLVPTTPLSIVAKGKTYVVP